MAANMRQREQAGKLKYCNSLGVFNKTFIPLALAGFEIVIANSALRASLAIFHLISNALSWNNCLISWKLVGYQVLKVLFYRN